MVEVEKKKKRSSVRVRGGVVCVVESNQEDEMGIYGTFIKGPSLL